MGSYIRRVVKRWHRFVLQVRHEKVQRKCNEVITDPGERTCTFVCKIIMWKPDVEYTGSHEQDNRLITFLPRIGKVSFKDGAIPDRSITPEIIRIQL